MRILITALILISSYAVAQAQSSYPDSLTKHTEYAIVFRDCDNSDGGYCIFFEDGSKENFLKLKNLKYKTLGQEAKRPDNLLMLLKYLASKGFELVTSTQTQITIQYIFKKP